MTQAVSKRGGSGKPNWNLSIENHFDKQDLKRIYKRE